jgi:hypothetical protein
MLTLCKELSISNVLKQIKNEGYSSLGGIATAV